MSQIKIEVEPSCAPHSGLRPGAAPPRNSFTRINPERLFTLGSLWLQNNKKPGRRTYKETRLRWNSLHNIYADYLYFQPNELDTDAEGEDLTRLSEIVGVAMGMAAMLIEFNVNLNRFSRFTTPGSKKKRVDFEYYSGSRRYFHETKGTTNPNTASNMRGDIAAKKQQSLQYVADQQKAGNVVQQAAISGSTGSIALYRHVSDTTFETQITLIDPPAEELANARPAGEADELACVLGYYQNFYKVTHPNVRNVRSFYIAEWLWEIIADLSQGKNAPRRAPRNLRVIPHLAEPDVPDSPYKGAIFDARIAWRSIKKFPTFEEATNAIPRPVTFLGVSQRVTDLIRACDWTGLLEFHDPGQFTDEIDGVDISDSGIMSRRIDPQTVNPDSEKAFLSMKRFLKMTGNRM